MLRTRTYDRRERMRGDNKGDVHDKKAIRIKSAAKKQRIKVINSHRRLHVRLQTHAAGQEASEPAPVSAAYRLSPRNLASQRHTYASVKSRTFTVAQNPNVDQKTIVRFPYGNIPNKGQDDARSDSLVLI